MMKHYILLIFICVQAMANIADSATHDSANYYKDSTQDSTDSAESAKDSTKNSADSTKESAESIFSPAIVSKSTFGAFEVGYQLLSKSSERIKHGAFFAIERGWNFIDNILLVSLSLDGTIGEFYSLNINANLGTRLLSGRLIPNLSLGYGLLNHKISGIQHNLHGANATIALFIDIAKGFGCEVAYRTSLYPFSTIKRTGTKTNLQSFLLNFKYIDFRI